VICFSYQILAQERHSTIDWKK